MVGQVVVHDQHVTALLHEIFRDAGRGIRRDVGQAGRVVALGHDDDGVFHRAVLAQVRDGLGDRRGALADRAIHAQHILAALVEYRVDRNRSLAGLSIPKNQLALAAPDRDQRIDHLDAGLQRHRDGRTIHDVRRGTLDRQSLVGDHRPLAVERTADRIHDAADHAVADRHIHHMAAALDLVAGVQMPVVAKQHDADLVLVDVERDAIQFAGKFHHFLVTDAGQSRDPRDAGGQAGHDADFVRTQPLRVRLAHLVEVREGMVNCGLKVFGFHVYLLIH